MDRTDNGKWFRMLTVIDEYTRACRAIKVYRKFNSADVIDTLFDLFVTKGIPDHIRSDMDRRSRLSRSKPWLAELKVNTLFIEPGSPWENGYNESFNGENTGTNGSMARSFTRSRKRRD